MSKTKSFAERELDILSKSNKDPENRPLVEEFRKEILAICEAFGNSGQSGGSAPYTANALSTTIKNLCLQKPICPITGIDEEWVNVSNMSDGEILYQNSRCSALFKEKRVYYLDAIVWRGDSDWDTFSGTVEGIRSRQYIKSFPFEPKTFYIDVHRVPYNKSIHKTNDAVSCSTGDFVYFIKDKNQLKDVFEYYDKYSDARVRIREEKLKKILS